MRFIFFALLAAVVANAEITILIERPVPWDSRVVEEVPVAARVGSTLELKSVIAEVADRRTDLNFSHMGAGPEPVFIGSLNLTNLARGTYALKVTATDIANSSTSVTQTIFLDRPPTVWIYGLTNNAVIRNPLVPVDIGCEDDGGGCQVEVYAGLFGGRIPYTNGVLNLTGWNHSWDVPLEIYAKETSGGGSFYSGRYVVHVEFSPRLIAEDSAAGAIFDFDERRILYQNGGVLGILDRTTRATTIITNFVEHGLLTTRGAVYVRRSSAVAASEVGEYPGGLLGPINSTHSLRARGSYMLWNDNTVLYRRNVETSQTEVISQNAGNWHNDLTAEGDAAWWGGNGNYTVFLNDQQMSTPLNGARDVYPRTDGTNVVWMRKVARVNPGPFPGDDHYIVLNDGSGENILTRALSGEPTPGPGYQVARGWVAYLDLGNAGQTHVWRRSPSGEKSQLSFFGTSSQIVSLNDRGDVLWTNGSDRYLNERRLGSFIGQPTFKNGQWHVVIGSELFLLDTEEPFSIKAEANTVVVNGTGVLESSTNLTEWLEVGTLDGVMSIPRNRMGTVKFYRLKR